MTERSRNRPISLSSIEQLAPGQILPPVLPGAPSYPPSNLYENPISRDQVRTRSRPTSIIGSSSSYVLFNGGVEQGGRVQEGNWSPSLERNTVKRHSIPILSTVPYPTTSSYQATPPSTSTSYHSSHPPAQYTPYINPIAAVITNQVPRPSSIQQQPILSPVELQYHQELVTYYLGYARQGRLAPITDERQERARLEAIAWARSEGVLLPDPVISNQPPPVAQYVTPSTQQYQVSAPSTPTRQQPFPLPSINTNTPPISNSTSFSNIAYLNRSTSLATATTTPILATSAAGLIRSSSAAASPSTSASNTPYSSNPPSPTKRPLPVPPTRSSTLPNSRPLPEPLSGTSRLPLDQLAHLNLNSNGNGITLTKEGVERRNSVPIPSFSFGTTVESISPSLVVVPPSFNIVPSSGRSLPSISIPTTSAPSFSTPTSTHSTPSSAHIHPRLDPSHPSHYLYHPTSTNTTSSNQRTIAAGTIVCTRCKVQMFGRALMALGKEWHPECFSCSKEGCGVLLEHVQFDGKKEGEEGGGEGEVFCMVHYEELYASKCYQCKTPIAAEEYVLVDSPLLLPPGPRTYHALHFFCSSCGDPFVDPKSLAKGKEGTLAAPFMVNKGFAYCQGCDLKMFRPKCSGCKKGIGGEWAEVEGKMWHVECFTCCRCEKPLTGDYLVKDDDEGSEGELPYCIPCYNIKARNE